MADKKDEARRLAEECSKEIGVQIIPFEETRVRPFLSPVRISENGFEPAAKFLNGQHSRKL